MKSYLVIAHFAETINQTLTIDAFCADGDPLDSYENKRTEYEKQYPRATKFSICEQLASYANF